jgi:polyisoprenyl-phosphate glycosyltransferase
MVEMRHRRASADSARAGRQQESTVYPDEPLISLVIPGLNEALCLPKLYEELRRVCDPLPYQFEFLFVDDGSTDATPHVLASLRDHDQRVRYVRLSRNFGHQAALSAGLAHAGGDAVITMDGDLQHPPDLIPQLLRQWSAGYEVVNTVRKKTDDAGPVKRAASKLFYKLFNWVANINIQPGGSDFRLMSRPAVDVLNRSPERDRFLRGLVPWLGFRQTQVEFIAPKRWAGRPKFTILRSLRFALDGITSFTFYPLRLLTFFGLMITTASLLYGIFSVASHLWTDSTVPGWTSLMLCVLFFGGANFMALGIISEYIGRILAQVKGRPLYIVRQRAGVKLQRGKRRKRRAARFA